MVGRMRVQNKIKLVHRDQRYFTSVGQIARKQDDCCDVVCGNSKPKHKTVLNAKQKFLFLVALQMIRIEGLV